MYRSTRQRARVNLVPSSILRHGVSWMIVFLWSAFRVKFPHSTILLHSVLGLRKQWQKKYIAIEKTDFFYNCMGLLGNFTAFSRVKKVGWCDIRRTVKQSFLGLNCQFNLLMENKTVITLSVFNEGLADCIVYS